MRNFALVWVSGFVSARNLKANFGDKNSFRLIGGHDPFWLPVASLKQLFEF